MAQKQKDQRVLVYDPEHESNTLIFLFLCHDKVLKLL